ncbi:MAG TPA: Gldg family protein, partial [Kiritimatiellia bacterium]
MVTEDTSEAEASIRKRGRRRAAMGMNIGAALALAAALTVMINYLSYRHYQRFDWSRSKYYSLSDKTKGLLASLTGRVDVVVFFQPGQKVYEDVDYLLKEYENQSRLIRVERVDPDRDLARTEELARKYKVEQANVVVFDCNGRSKFVAAGDVVDMDYSAVMQGGKAEITGFKGEQAFSSAIENVTHGRVPVVYVLAGHGEGDTENRDESTGYSIVRQHIERDNVEVRTFKLGDQPSVPADADAVILLGPKKRLAASEVDMLRKY